MDIPERRLDDQARAERRAELMEAISADRRRRPWVAPLAAAAVVAVVGGAAYGVATLRDSGSSAPPVGGSGSASAEDTTLRESVTPSTTVPTVDACASEPPVPGPGGTMREYREQLPVVQAYRDVLAAHLDPKGAHLERKASNVQSSGSGCGLGALGTKVGWSVPGESGLGMVQVEVSTGDDATQVHMSHAGWRRLRVDVAGITSAEQVQYAGGFAVQVVRDDGLTVAIDANLLFGNNSLEPIGAFPFSVADLVEAAADPGLQLP